MQRHILILISAMTLMIGAAVQVLAIDLDRADDKHDPHQEHEQQQYICPMHPDVLANHPGNCPKCGMKLVPVPEEKGSPHSDKLRADADRRPIHNHQSHMSDSPHEMHQHPPSHSGHAMQMEMRSSIDLADPMSREGSGTSWLPDSSPM